MNDKLAVYVLLLYIQKWQVYLAFVQMSCLYRLKIWLFFTKPL